MQLSDVVRLLKIQAEIGQPPLRHNCDEMFVMLSREFHLQVVLVLVGSKDCVLQKLEWQRVTLAMDEGRLIRHERRQELDRLQQQAAWGLGFETTIIEGGPGTGKSLVLISRALWLSNALLNSKILLLTWNRSLADALGAWRGARR